MASINNLPVINLWEDNIKKEWNNLIISIKNCSFIAIDVEMSGLGSKKNINNPSIDDRYIFLKNSASNYCVLSLGLSCFSIEFSNEKNQKSALFVKNKTYNLNTLCIDDFKVETESIKFLLEHGLNFNKIFQNGITYSKGNDKLNEENNKQYLRELMIEISISGIPIILHNGFIDLVFLYENFYANCPNNLNKFIADISDIFKNGLYDTKYIADFFDYSNASYLEYLYNSSLYENTLNKSVNNQFFKIFFDIENKIELANYEINLEKIILTFDEHRHVIEDSICKTYSTYGYCSNLINKKCKKNHNIDTIIKLDVYKREKKKRGKLKNKTDEVESISKIIRLECENEINLDYNKLNKIQHNAGSDAFMTGFVMLNFLKKFSKFELIEEKKKDRDNKNVILNDFNNMDFFKNNLNLTGKNYPLIVRKSNFSSFSVNHQNKKLGLINKND